MLGNWRDNGKVRERELYGNEEVAEEENRWCKDRSGELRWILKRLQLPLV